MDSGCNFSELKQRINDWTADDEDILLRKLKSFSDKYISKCDDLSKNLSNLDKNLNLIEIDYFNAINSLKNVSIKKFVEHVIDTNDTRPFSNTQINESSASGTTDPLLISREEREANLLNKFKNAISKSLDYLNIKNLLDVGVKNDGDAQSIVEDDNVSVTSSRYFANNMSRQLKNLKLPYIIGTNDFFKSKYLGITNETSILPNANQNEEINLDRKLSVVSEIPQNIVEDIKVGPSVPSVPGVPSVPKVPGVPNIPKVPSVPPKIPGVPNVPGIPHVPGVPGVPKVPGVPNVPGVQNNLQTSAQDPIQDTKKTPLNPAEFRESLTQMLNKNTGSTNIMTPQENNNTQNTMMNVNDFSKQKQNLLQNIKRPTIFDDDDDDDDTGLFSKKAKTGFSSQPGDILKDKQVQSNQSKRPDQLEIIPEAIPPQGRKEFVQEVKLPGKTYTFSEEEDSQVQFKKSQPKIIANPTKNTNLEKAKTTLLKMFDDDEDDSFSQGAGNTIKITEKTSDLTNRVTQLTKDSKIEKDLPAKPISKPVESGMRSNVNLTTKSEVGKPSVVSKKAIFIDDDENDILPVKKPEVGKKEEPEKKAEVVKKIEPEKKSEVVKKIEPEKKPQVEKKEEPEVMKKIEPEVVKKLEPEKKPQETEKKPQPEKKGKIIEDPLSMMAKQTIQKKPSEIQDPLSRMADSKKTPKETGSIKTEPMVAQEESISPSQNVLRSENSAKFSDLRNMLGSRMNQMGGVSGFMGNAMNPPSEPRKTSIEYNPQKKEEENKEYEDIINQKTSIINKKKPKFRAFGSKLNDNLENQMANTAEDSSKSFQPINPFGSKDAIKERPKEEDDFNLLQDESKTTIKTNDAINKQKEELTEISNSSAEPQKKNYITFNPGSSYKNLDTSEIKEGKSTKSTLPDIFSDESTAKPNKPETKLKATLFDFDDNEVVPPKNPPTTATAAQPVIRGSAAAKIKFLYDDDDE